MSMDTRHAKRAGDGWLDCTCGQKHWGLHGAAGLLLARAPRPHEPRTSGRSTQGPAAGSAHTEVVLQHRALWSHHGGSWGVPGGAIAPDESPVEGALREAQEEAGIDPGDVLVHATHVVDHGPWAYTTVVATLRADAAGTVTEADDESLEVRWVPVPEVAALPLLPAFADAWPHLGLLVERAVGNGYDQ